MPFPLALLMITTTPKTFTGDGKQIWHYLYHMGWSAGFGFIRTALILVSRAGRNSAYKIPPIISWHLYGLENQGRGAAAIRNIQESATPADQAPWLRLEIVAMPDLITLYCAPKTGPLKGVS